MHVVTQEGEEEVAKVHRVKGREVIPRYRLIPYEELVDVLKDDGAAFLEDDADKPLKRGTIWKAARKLSEMTKKKVVYKKVLMRLERNSELVADALEGYLFSLEGSK